SYYFAWVYFSYSSFFSFRGSTYLFCFFFFFFNDTATTEIYTLSLHDALPIFPAGHDRRIAGRPARGVRHGRKDRKSTRLNSSHVKISYAVFCLKKKKKTHGIHSHKKKKKAHNNPNPQRPLN